MIRKERNMKMRAFVLTGLIMLMLTGCATTTTDEGAGMLPTANVSTSAVGFQDIQIPAELEWDREHSMSIATESFAGGTMRFAGRVEVNSLADFFAGSMVRNQWKLAGTVKSRNVIMAFTKPNKTCTVTIFEAKFTGKTLVDIYITDDISARSGASSFSMDPMR